VKALLRQTTCCKQKGDDKPGGRGLGNRNTGVMTTTWGSCSESGCMAKCAHRSVLEHEGDATNMSKTVHIENSCVDQD